MKILITGSSGMLGSDLCDTLVAEHKIIGIDMAGPVVAHSGAHVFYKTDITDPEKIEEIFEKEKPDIVLHTAAWTDVDGCEKDPEKAYTANTRGTEYVTEASKKHEAALIFISTDFVFDGEKSTPYTEDDVSGPLCVYARSKLEAEKIVENTLERYIIVRTGWLYGKNGKNFVDTIISKAKEEGALKVVNDQVGSPTYTMDLSQALKKLIECFDTFGKETYNISNEGMCSWWDFASRILEDAGINNITVEPIKSEMLGRPAKRPAFSVLDKSKFRKATGHAMRSWQDALDDYLNVS